MSSHELAGKGPCAPKRPEMGRFEKIGLYGEQRIRIHVRMHSQAAGTASLEAGHLVPDASQLDNRIGRPEARKPRLHETVIERARGIPDPKLEQTENRKEITIWENSHRARSLLRW